MPFSRSVPPTTKKKRVTLVVSVALLSLLAVVAVVAEGVLHALDGAERQLRAELERLGECVQWIGHGFLVTGRERRQT